MEAHVQFRQQEVKKQAVGRNRGQERVGGPRFLEARDRGGPFGGDENVGPFAFEV